MKHRNDEINDNEIRIITSHKNSASPAGKRIKIIACVALAALAAIMVFLYFRTGGETQEPSVERVEASKSANIHSDILPQQSVSPVSKGHTVSTDTVVGTAELTVLTPHDAVPVLEIGPDVPYDTAAVLIVQAADIRADNGKIAGSFVLKGNLISKGEAKAGYCSIINDEISIGVAQATPALEQALTSDGYFFRQYPLVVAGQVVENKPKGKSIRRALAEIDGKTHVILSRNRLTFHDFSQALADIGVNNAIYLVGGKAFCCYTDSAGKKNMLGHTWGRGAKNANYIVWR